MFFDTSIRYAQVPDYQICAYCVMDTSATEIVFNIDGTCSFCKGVEYHLGRNWFPDAMGERYKLEKYSQIRTQGLGKKYDCVLGLSGGLDSAVVAVEAVKNGLRPLALHIDAGWNTNESVTNVEKLSKYLNIDLHTVVIDWNEMRRLQIAYLKSNVMNQDTPQDHALFASMYSFSKKNGISTLLSGVNYTSESVQPASWGYTYADGKQLKYIAKKFGNIKLRKYPVMTIKQYKKITEKKYFEIFRPLDFGAYDPTNSSKQLAEKIGWKAYGAKHAESLFTNFYQSVYLIEKFGIDKRRNHYSSLIISKLMSRQDAVKELASPPIEPIDRKRLISAVCAKLQVSTSEMDTYLSGVIIDHYSLPNDSAKI
jgi:N-acetyl sugar amidotransferase